MTDPARPAFALADALVDSYAAAAPSFATFAGVPGHDHRWDDFGPDGVALRTDLARSTHAAVSDLPPTTDPWEQLARDCIRDWAAQEVETVESGDHWLDLNSLSSTFQVMRMVLDTMPVDTADARENVRRRLAGLGAATEGYRALLAEGLLQGRVVGRRQVEAALRQGAAQGGADDSFARVAARCVAAEPGLADAMASAVADARMAYAALCTWMREVYLPQAGPDAVGRARYARAARRHLGMDIDPAEAYAWGWTEIGRIEAALAELAAEVRPGATAREAVTWLQTAPEYCDATAEAFLARMKERQRVAFDRLDGVHFAVPEPARKLDVLLAPAGGMIGAYYMPPGEDFSRPGSVWYALESPTDIPWFDEVSTAYHEGFPGHHLQIATTVAQRDRLSRFSRTMAGNTGYAEGWALYAEQLMFELGFLESPAEVMGMYVGQLARAWRVVVDIGLHLELEIPAQVNFHPGARWTPAIAVEAMHERGMLSAATAVSEVDRYLGWPGQAITYKLGQRVILGLRDEARAALGAAYDPRAFHARVLEVGSVGLGRLQSLMRAPGGFVPAGG
jgi:uncharacterized protein (DUF885 family)